MNKRMRWLPRVFLATHLLALSITGHAGVQSLDRALAALLFPLHLHGVVGEAAYVDAVHGPAPFVSGHCHAAPDLPPPSSDASLVVAVTLAVGGTCKTHAQPLPVLGGKVLVVQRVATPLVSHSLIPDAPPPRMTASLA